MNDSPWLTRLFQAIDARDAEAFASYLTPDAVFRYGNAPPVQGRDACRAVVAGFFSGIRGLRHAVRESWALRDTVVAHGEVTYTRLDGSELTVPFANVLKLEESCVREYLIFVDASSL